MIDPKKYFTRHNDKQDARDIGRVPLERKAIPIQLGKPIPTPVSNTTVRQYVAFVEECNCVEFGTLPNGQPCLTPARCLATLYELDLSKNVTADPNDLIGGYDVERNIEAPLTCLETFKGREDEPIKHWVYNKSHRKYCQTFVWVEQDLNGHFWIDEPQENIILYAQVDIPCGAVGLCVDECGMGHLACNKSCRTLHAGLGAVAYYHCSSCPGETPFVFAHVDGPSKARAVASSDACGEVDAYSISEFSLLDCCCLTYTAPIAVVSFGHCFRSGDTLYLTWNDCEQWWEVVSVIPSTKIKVLTAAIECEDEETEDPCEQIACIKFKTREICTSYCDEEETDPIELLLNSLEFALKKVKSSRVRMNVTGDVGEETCNLQSCDSEDWVLTVANGDEICPDPVDDCVWADLFVTGQADVLTDVQLSGLDFVGTFVPITTLCARDSFTSTLFTGVECP